MALSKLLPGLVVSFLLVAVSFAAPTAALQVVSWIVLGREHKHGKLEVAVEQKAKLTHSKRTDWWHLEIKQNTTSLFMTPEFIKKTQSLIEKPKH